MSILFVCLDMMLFVTTPTDVVLSTYIGVRCCGHIVSISVWCNSTYFQAVISKVDNSTSVADDITNLIICAIVRTTPLKAGIGTFSERHTCVLARLLALSSFK